ncbi:hypothetical protein C8R46DRAFT_1349166 [Mycena filopes]|nr:hypothetical protein C8R46DRAFT_1349166 [Mycena filopes]
MSSQAPYPGATFPALHLYPLDDSFIPKRIALAPGQRVKIARPPNTKTQPGERNGYFDSRVLSRQHAEVWEEGNKIFIKDVKSSNGTFINGERLSLEGRESDPYELKSDDILEFGVDIVSEDNKTVLHRKVVARVACVFPVGPSPFSQQNKPSLYGAPPLPGDQFATVSSSGVFSSSSSPPNARRPQQQQQQHHQSQQHHGQVPLIHALGGMGGAGPRAPGRGLTLDHIFSRLQAELAKSREAGRELQVLGGALGGIGESISGGGPPTALPTYPDPLPPVRPPSLPSVPPVPSPSPPNTTSSPTSASSSSSPEQHEKQLDELQRQLRALAADVEGLRALGAAQEAMRGEVRALREVVAVRRRDDGRRAEEEVQRGGEGEGEEEEGGDVDDGASDTDSIMTATPHELEAVEEEEEEEEEEEGAREDEEAGMEDVSLEDGEAPEAEALADARRHARAMQAAQDERVEREMHAQEREREREMEVELEIEEREENMRRERAQTPEPSEAFEEGMLELEVVSVSVPPPHGTPASASLPPAQLDVSTTTVDTTADADAKTKTNPEVAELTARLAVLSAQLEGALAAAGALQRTIGVLEERVGKMEAQAAVKAPVVEEEVVVPVPVVDSEAEEVEVVEEAPVEVLKPNGDVTAGKSDTHIDTDISNMQLREIQTQLESLRAELAAERGKREAWERELGNNSAQGGRWMGGHGHGQRGRVNGDVLGREEHEHGSGSGSVGSGSSRSRSQSVEMGIVEEVDEEDVEHARGMDVDLGLRFPGMKTEELDADEKWNSRAPAVVLHSNGDAAVHQHHAHAHAHVQLNLQTAFGVLVLGVAAAAVLWRVKPE